TNWQDAYFEGMDVPNVKGYVPSVSKIERANAKDVTTPLTVTVSYTAGNQTVAVKFVDDQKSGEEVASQTKTGKTGQTIELSSPNDKYELVSPSSYTFKAENNAPIIVHLKHATKAESTSKSVVRDIIFKKPTG
ncbi:mucin-binding protein, partial [Lactobacillus gallinarum]|uniref:mucin-binding protein n=1 Tax=Lactobacillus gallinarum TaxID=52242 RepID=UPI00195C2257